MGLAPYGEPIYVDIIKEKLISIREDGSFHLDMSYFGYLNDLRMTNDRFGELFGGPARAPETPIGKREMDLARSIQVVTEEIMEKIARFARAITGKRNLCLAGGVALNCVSNGKLVRSKLFDEIWVQPAAGDAGGSLGAALYAWYRVQGNKRKTDGRRDAMKGGFLGPGFTQDQVKGFLDLNELALHRDARRRAQRVPGQGARRREGGGPAPGPDGVRPARIGRPVDHRRRAQREDAVVPEPRDQVPRELPPLRAHRAQGRRARVLRGRPRVALHAHGRPGEEGALHLPPAMSAPRSRRARPSTSKNG